MLTNSDGFWQMTSNEARRRIEIHGSAQAVLFDVEVQIAKEVMQWAANGRQMGGRLAADGQQMGGGWAADGR